MKNKKIPMRSCVVTKEKLPKQELLRVVRTPEGTIIVDDTLKANGRGCYLKKDLEVIKKAETSKGKTSTGNRRSRSRRKKNTDNNDNK